MTKNKFLIFNALFLMLVLTFMFTLKSKNSINEVAVSESQGFQSPAEEQFLLISSTGVPLNNNR